MKKGENQESKRQKSERIGNLLFRGDGTGRMKMFLPELGRGLRILPNGDTLALMDEWLIP